MTDQHVIKGRYLCLSHATALNARTLQKAHSLYHGADGRYASPMYEQYVDPSLATLDRRCEGAIAGSMCDDIYRWHVEDRYTSDIRQSHVNNAQRDIKS